MPGLTDIKPVPTIVKVPSDGGDIPLTVKGIGIDSIRLLLARFPDLWVKMGNGMTASLILSEGPVVAAAVIVAACGEQGEEAEAAAAALPLGIQAEILAAAINMTMPKGRDPFDALLKSLGFDLSEAALSASS